MTADSAKPRREVKVDLSGLSTEQAFVRRNVVALGERVFGSRWQTDLAAAISKEVGRKISQGQVSHWVAGISPVPAALVEPIRNVALRMAKDMERRAADVRADWAKAPPAKHVKAIEAAP